MDSKRLFDLASEFGTPAFVFDTDAFAERARAISSIFGERVSLCFAVKANPFLIPEACKGVDKLEVCSPGELEICKRLGVDPAMVVFSGVNKTAESVRVAAEFGVGVFTAESKKHVRLIEDDGRAFATVHDVLLRLNAGSQFGMSKSDLVDIVESRAEFGHVNIVGIHYFVGTQRTNLKHQFRELEKLKVFLDELREEHGLEVERLEYGPGLGVALFEGDDSEDTLEPARQLASALQDVACNVELTVEMGRVFATECGTYLTSVNDTKDNDDTSYCIVDGGINHLTYVGQLMGMKTPVIENLSALQRGEERGDDKQWCVCGSLCTTGDVLARQATLCDVREGDVFAFANAGAYAVTEGVYLFLSREMPRIVLARADGSARVVRDAFDTSILNTAQL